MKKTILIMVIAGIFAVSNTNAQDKNLLKQVQEKFNSISTITADITQTTGNRNLNGKFFYKQKNKFRLEFSNFTIISDGSVIWNYNKTDNKVIINEVDENDPSAVSFDKLLNEYPDKSNVSLAKENGISVLELTPKQNYQLNFDVVRLWINNDSLVEKVRIEKSGNPMEIEISNYRLNQEIQNSLFTFTAPEGTQVIDLR